MSYILSSDARRRALLSSLSPKLSDAAQFPLSAILAKLPTLPDDPLLDAPAQLPLPLPLPSGPPAPTTSDYNDHHLPQAQASASGDPQPAPKTVPLPPDDLSDSDDRLKTDKKKKKKRFLGSRSLARWRTRFWMRG